MWARMEARGISPTIFSTDNRKTWLLTKEEADLICTPLFPSPEEINETEFTKVNKDSILFSCVSEQDKPQSIKFDTTNKNFCRIKIKQISRRTYYTMTKEQALILAEEINKRYG